MLRSCTTFRAALGIEKAPTRASARESLTLGGASTPPTALPDPTLPGSPERSPRAALGPFKPSMAAWYPPGRAARVIWVQSFGKEMTASSLTA
jgi:hypothetical protein